MYQDVRHNGKLLFCYDVERSLVQIVSKGEKVTVDLQELAHQCEISIRLCEKKCDPPLTMAFEFSHPDLAKKFWQAFEENHRIVLSIEDGVISSVEEYIEL